MLLFLAGFLTAAVIIMIFVINKATNLEMDIFVLCCFATIAVIFYAGGMRVKELEYEMNQKNNLVIETRAE